MREMHRETGMERGGRRRFMAGLAMVFLALMVISLFQAWPELPERIPLHFSADGTSNRDGSPMELAIIVLVALLSTLPLMAGGFWISWIRRHPRWINIPRKEAFLALPPEFQLPYWEWTAEFMVAIGAAMALLFLLLVRAIIAVVVDGVEILPWWAVWPGLGALLLALLVYLPRLITLPGKLIREAGRNRGH